MATTFDIEKKLRKVGLSLDKATLEMIKYAERSDIETVFKRQGKYDEKRLKVVDDSRCPFGSIGVCCRQCAMGPCRIRHESLPIHVKTATPATDKGTCGASADTIVARNLLMTISRGMSAHASHAKHVARALSLTASGKTGYSIKDTTKLNTVAKKLGISTDQPQEKIAWEIARVAIRDLSGNDVNSAPGFAEAYLPSIISDNLAEMGIMPGAADEELMTATHRVSMGVMADHVSLLLNGLKLGLADIVSLIISTEIQDILFGVPAPIFSTIGFRCLKKNEVNIAVHGHVPVLSEKVVEWSRNKELLESAKMQGANGINVVGICCTGNEILMRHGTPIAGSNLQQELVIATGLVEAMVVDVQCIFPAITNTAAKFHTKVITTMSDAILPGALHIPFEESSADESARKIVEEAILNFPKRTKKTFLPKAPTLNMMAGFSTESCIGVLSKVNVDDPLKPMIDNILNGNIQGVVLLAGCTSPKVQSDASHVTIAKSLLEDDILIIATGCAAQACARAGLLTSEATEEYAGENLKSVLASLGHAAGMDKPLPPVWHFGSCVDNSRVINLVCALADRLQVHVKDLPIAASAAEWVTEKAAAIGAGAIALGITTHLGITPPILGGNEVVKILTEKAAELVGGKFIVEIDPEMAARRLKNVIEEKRDAMNL